MLTPCNKNPPQGICCNCKCVSIIYNFDFFHGVLTTSGYLPIYVRTPMALNENVTSIKAIHTDYKI